MPIQSINNQILELIISTDKKNQNFINSLKPGDTLNGKIIDLFQNENKALINFRGHNLIAQLPQNVNLHKGDIINVIIYNTNNKIYMRLNNFTINNNQIGLPVNNNLVGAIDILNILNSLKIPANEHNFFIAQNLIKYQLPVNKENIIDINNAFNKYVEDKGIDIRVFNPQNENIAREIIISNFIKFNKNIIDIINNLNQNYKYDLLSLSNILQKLTNLTNISLELNKFAKNVDISVENNSLIINSYVNNKENLNNILSLLIKQNILLNENLNNIFNKINEKINLSNNMSLIIKENGATIRFDNLMNNINLAAALLNKIGGNHSSTINDIIFNLNNINSVQKQVNNFNPLLINLKNIFEQININFFRPGNISLNQNIKEINNLMNLFKNELNNIKSSISLDKNDINRITVSLNKCIEVLSSISFKNKIIPQDFINYQNVIKQFVNDVNNIFKFNTNENNYFASRIINLDLESIIESITFLKSRNIDISNNKFIDIMSNYLSNNMKLSHNIEKFNFILNNFMNNINNNIELKQAFEPIINIINNIKSTLSQISIKPDISRLESNVIINQLHNFFNKTGLNLENTIKNIATNNLEYQQRTGDLLLSPSGHDLKTNLKSLLLSLTNSLEQFNSSDLISNIKKSLTELRDISRDILHNLNAIQLINQKQSAIDLIYTQIPVFLDSKYFHGELQVWYRKDGAKQDLGNLIPVNILFILNTSNLGQIKINLIVFKNQIDCIIRTQSDKAKQILNRNKNDFIEKLNQMNYKINDFTIKIEEAQDSNEETIYNQYINLTNINLRA